MSCRVNFWTVIKRKKCQNIIADIRNFLVMKASVTPPTRVGLFPELLYNRCVLGDFDSVAKHRGWQPQLQGLAVRWVRCISVRNR